MPNTSASIELREIGSAGLLLNCTGGLSWEERTRLASAVEEYLATWPGVTAVVCDLAAVTFVNSAGLGALCQLVGRLRARGARLIFTSVPQPIARMFSTVGMDRLAETARDVPAALAVLGLPAPPVGGQA